MRQPRGILNRQFGEIQEEGSGAETPGDHRSREHEEGIAGRGEARPSPSQQRSRTDSPTSRAAGRPSLRSRSKTRAGASPAMPSRAATSSQHRGTPTRRLAMEASQQAGQPAGERGQENEIGAAGAGQEFRPTKGRLPP